MSKTLRERLAQRRHSSHLRRDQKRAAKMERRATKQQLRAEKKLKRLEKKQRRKEQSQLLQARLTRSYRRVTVIAVFLIATVGSWLLWHLVFRYAPTPENIAWSALQSAKNAAPILQSSQPNRAQLLSTLKPLEDKRFTSAITDVQGLVIASTPGNALRTGVGLKAQAQLPEGAERLWQRAARGETDASLLGGLAPDGSTFAVVPIKNSNRVLGLLWTRSAAPVRPKDFGRALFAILFVCGISVGIFAAVVGTAFGFLTARRLTQRLQNISEAADAWSKGDFYVVANDDSPDEIGQLARRLNQMAGELQQLVTLRQNLATSEERNRLARELHDTVKQQVFATAMQVGAAHALIERDPGAAKLRLVEAEKLARGAQGELTGILEQLRPGSYAKIGESATEFSQTLRQTATDWSRQSGIEVRLHCEQVTLPPNAQQTLLRIVQEALSNAARHSGASRVLIMLQHENGEVELNIHDNGRGFVPDKTQSGMGLRNMRERAESLPDGKFEVQNDEGTRLQIRFKL